MTWTQAITKVLEELIRQKDLDVTKVSENAGYASNYISKLKAGKKKFISNDELDPIAQVLEVDTWVILQNAKEKKTLQII